MAKPSPVSRSDFHASAQPLTIAIPGSKEKLSLAARDYSTGSFGFCYTGKITVPITVNGQTVNVPCQAACNVTVIGSKPNGAE